MTGNRARITLSPLRTTLYGAQGLGGSIPLPEQWEPLADLHRGDGSGGVLVRHRATRLYALWTGVGSIETVPQHKIAGALAAIAHQSQEAAMTFTTQNTEGYTAAELAALNAELAERLASIETDNLEARQDAEKAFHDEVAQRG